MMLTRIYEQQCAVFNNARQPIWDMKRSDTRGLKLGMILQGLSAHFNDNFTRERFFTDTL